MKTVPTKKWLEEYADKKHFLVPFTNLQAYFEKNEIAGKRMFVCPAGYTTFVTDKVLVRDPLVYLGKDAVPYFLPVKPGKYPIVIAVVEVEEEHYRYAGFRVQLDKTKKVVQYYEALLGNEDLGDVGEGEYFGFNVDAGLATLVDTVTRDAYCDFEEAWVKEHKGANFYDDYLADLFKENGEKYPEFQREGGDWINFVIPNTTLTVPMIQTGFGDGTYPVYFGFDELGEIVEIFVEFIDIELAFSDRDEEDDDDDE